MECFQRRGCISASQDESMERNSMARQCSSGHEPTSCLSHLSITHCLIPMPLPSYWMSAQAQSPCPLSNLVPLGAQCTCDSHPRAPTPAQPSLPQPTPLWPHLEARMTTYLWSKEFGLGRYDGTRQKYSSIGL